jgi:protein ImuB
MLWIALYLPDLPLQLAQRASPTPRPCVIADGPALRPLVHCANLAARERGVTQDMPVAAARALAGELLVLPREETSEAQALHNLGCWASQFTPGVVLQTGEGLLLDVGSTLQLHGGLSRLLIRLGQGMKDLGYHAEPGVAPTPHAAWVLAKARHAGLRVRMCRDAALLPERLDTLPLALLDWPEAVLLPLQTLGIHRIGQCLNLPRDGFIRRFGAARRLELDKLLGSALDPRAWFTPPDTFANRVDFGFEVAAALMLLFPLKRLLQELEGFLRGRGAGVQRWQLVLDHMSHGRTCLTLGTSAPERSAERLLALARERLTQTTLPGPVLGLGLVAEELLLFAESNSSFLPDSRTRAIGWGQLVDKLSTRLGSEKVWRLRALDDHRPEHGWKQEGAAAARTRPAEIRGQSKISRTRSAEPKNGERNFTLPPTPRPLWLLRTPRTLLTADGKPLCHGRLRLVAGPERIESGWWDGRSARRDYYVARNANGETFWIYREHRLSKAWYLHGVFG